MKTLTLKKFFQISIAASSLFCVSLGGATDVIPWDAEWDYMHKTDGVDPLFDFFDFDIFWPEDPMTFEQFYENPEFGADPAIVGETDLLEPGPYFDSGRSRAPIGYGAIDIIEDDPIFEPVGNAFVTELTVPPRNARLTAFFRHDFEVTEEMTEFGIDVVMDDGGVVYLDGDEIARFNFSGIGVYDDLASRPGPENRVQSGHVTFPITIFDFVNDTEKTINSLTVGSHTIAVSVHQVRSSDSDLAFALRMHDDPPPPGPPIGITDFGELVGEGVIEEDERSGFTESPAGSMFYTINNAGGSISSRPVDLSRVTGAVFSMLVEARDNSTGSNFETGDTLSAELSLRDSSGAITVVKVFEGTTFDVNNNGILNGDDDSPEQDEFNINNRPESDRWTARLQPIEVAIPDDVVSLTLDISGSNNSSSETFTIKDLLIKGTGSAPPVAPFEITGIVANATSGYDVTFQSVPGSTYELKAGIDLADLAAFNAVANTVATETLTTLTHANPGNLPIVFYVVEKQ